MLTDQAELNLKYGQLFADQSKCTERKTKLHNNKTETQMSKKRTNHKGIEYSRTYTTWTKPNKVKQLQPDSPILELQNSSRKSKIENNEKMDQENFFHWGQFVKLRKLSGAETILRKREGWWSREMHYPDRAHWDADTTTKARKHFPRHPDRTKEFRKR